MNNRVAACFLMELPSFKTELSTFAKVISIKQFFILPVYMSRKLSGGTDLINHEKHFTLSALHPVISENINIRQLFGG
jgi:hypothetical protein